MKTSLFYKYKCRERLLLQIQIYKGVNGVTPYHPILHCVACLVGFKTMWKNLNISKIGNKCLIHNVVVVRKYILHKTWKIKQKNGVILLTKAVSNKTNI